MKDLHYNAEYFQWQKDIGFFGGRVNKRKFESYIKPSDKVIDFGCGGGYLLANLKCHEKLGIEVNPEARKNAAKLGINAVATIDEVPNDWADVIISNNALEHTHYPLKELEGLYHKLKPGGKIIFVVPCENISYHYVPEDVNQHMYSWSPMCAGNLFTLAGFQVTESKPYMHKWPRRYTLWYRLLGESLFHRLCQLWSRFERTWFQTRVIAVK